MNENIYKQNINSLFCKENVEQIVVPEIVKVDLLSILEEKLKKAGFYYRVAYRVKAVDSIVDKLIYKDYRRPGTESEDKKMQDLVGIRIILYFTDDLTICRNLLDTLFSEPGQWETTEKNEYEFKAMKINGIFRLPAYLSKTIINPVLSEYVDDTFEIQVRTNSFEGWHEIEHDLRYKGSAFGIGNEVLARKMNSILATYELCDDSIVKLLEDLGHQHYKDHKWGDMIRCHFRIKLDNEDIDPEIAKIFDENTELAKCFFKFPRQRLIEQLWRNTTDRGYELTVSNIICLVNHLGPNDEKLNQFFASNDHAKSEYEANNKRKRFEPFKKLGIYRVFQASTYIDLTNLSIEDAFRKATGYIYSWVHSRFTDVFSDLSENVDSYAGCLPGYSVEVLYDSKNLYFSEKTSHLDTRVSSRVWLSNAVIQREGDALHFTVTNEYAEPTERFRDNENVLFSRPNFYGEIADNIGIRDVVRLRENVKKIDAEVRYEEMDQLINNKQRNFPVVVFMAEDNRWSDKFDVNYFAHLVGYYAHIKLIDSDKYCRRFAQEYNLDQNRYQDSITVFYAGLEPQTSYKADILDTTFEVIKLERKKYWNENGCRAYRRQLVSQIREDNVHIEMP